MTCHGPLQEFTVMLVDGQGIKGLWCSGPCLADIHSLSFIRRMEEHVIESIERRAKFQNEQSDEVPEEDG